MAAWRYEISLRVLNNISRVSERSERVRFILTREEKFRISSGQVIFFLLYKHQ